MEKDHSKQGEPPFTPFPIVGALRELLKNPMPHDLIAIRREVEKEYGGDEEAAKSEMDAWCSQEYMEGKIASHREAWRNAAEVIRKFDTESTIVCGGPLECLSPHANAIEEEGGLQP